MATSPHYDEIVFRALELLNAPEGFNGHTREEIRSWRRDNGYYHLDNSAGCALIRARDEIGVRFPKTEHYRAQRAIKAWFKAGRWKEMELAA